jgi:hypothetical protein
MTQPSRFEPYTSQELDAALNELMMLLARLIAKTHMNNQHPTNQQTQQNPTKSNKIKYI